ncbi:outer membrane lipoprotein-sorting protein [Sulfuritalea sp.]|uniref:outer membrane lipoprotein-sorting protein n=1 Tax=Sulfuritalea sp. TaxID=2480090 RepID=UPI00286E87F7|nr:outer membrane lipoprotein-sorting protein [Sulfuritalea sp.]
MITEVRKLLTGFILAAALALASASASASVPDAVALLKSSDQARGGGLLGLLWEVDIVTRGAGEQQSAMKMRIKAADNASVAETLEPIRSKGGKMLQVGRNMWLTKPGLKKPLPISPRQRLSGQAAIGDIAATNYVRDYAATVLKDDSSTGESCYVLELKAVNNQTTYDRLHYWVSKARGVAVHAEFLSLSGKRLKTADFKYGNTIEIDGKRVPFVSKMTISDDLTDAITTLDYSGVKVQHIPASEFSVSNLE